MIHLKGLLKELVTEMRIRKLLHRIDLKKANKDGTPSFDSIVLLNWHKYIGLREFTARLFNVEEQRIAQIVDDKNIYVTTEAEMNRLKEMMKK